MEGLREHAKGFILKAMRDGKYPKTEEQQRAEIDEFEQQTWMVHGNTYCKAYVEAVNKKCRDMWLTAQQIPWLFVDFERLVDVTLEEAMRFMRIVTNVLDEAKKITAECNAIRDTLLMTGRFAELRDSLVTQSKDVGVALQRFTEVSFPGLSGQFPGVEYRCAKESLNLVSKTIVDMVKLWTSTDKVKVILSKEDYEEKLAVYNSLSDQLVRLKPDLERAILLHQQLRVVHGPGVKYVEAYAQIDPSYSSIVVPLPIPVPKTVLSFPGSVSRIAPAPSPAAVPKFVHSTPPAVAAARLAPPPLPTTPSRVRERDDAAAGADNETEVAIIQPPAKRVTPPKKTK